MSSESAGAAGWALGWGGGAAPVRHEPGFASGGGAAPLAPGPLGLADCSAGNTLGGNGGVPDRIGGFCSAAG